MCYAERGIYDEEMKMWCVSQSSRRFHHPPFPRSALNGRVRKRSAWVPGLGLALHRLSLPRQPHLLMTAFVKHEPLSLTLLLFGVSSTATLSDTPSDRKNQPRRMRLHHYMCPVVVRAEALDRLEDRGLEPPQFQAEFMLDSGHDIACECVAPPPNPNPRVSSLAGVGFLHAHTPMREAPLLLDTPDTPPLEVLTHGELTSRDAAGG